MIKHHPSALFAGVAALLFSGAPVQAADPPPAPAAAPSIADGAPREISLVTGDTVLVAPDGRLAFAPGSGRQGVTHVEYRGADGDKYVVPNDAFELLDEGVLDRRLFNVTDLVADGYADTGVLPVIVRDEPGEFDAMAATGGLWDRVTDGRVDRVWLDGKSRFTLAESVPQIGAPAAWESGYTGEGVTVAVLDGGYDPTHPDLAGRVKAAKDFTDTSPGAVDGFGHGTHVASTVAGSGAASNGKYKGVAPDADLLIAKVCSDDGFCTDSAIIEALSWAAANGADVANMSLGGYPSDGTDPLSLAVDEITESSGMLVVISAGNDGCSGCVNAPGSADRALTVGSVTKADELSFFSSQGPRYGDGAVKPDIAAPGTAITAARASGTAMGAPVDEFYTTADGTSMAAPHTTGAVALLKQAHPDWTADRLKAALMGASHGLDGLSVFQQGAGRLDVTDLSGKVTPDVGSLSFGMFAYPYASDPAAKNVTYTNDTDADIELTLAVTGDAMFTVDSPKVTVPAHGSATVGVSATTLGGTAGNYGAVLTATATGISVRTAIGAVLEPPMYDLNIDIDTRDGGPVVPDEFGDRSVAVYGLDNWVPVDLDEEGRGSVRVTAGRYQVIGSVFEDGDTDFRTNFIDDVTITTADVDFTVDLGLGELIDVDVDADDAVLDVTLAMISSLDSAGVPLFTLERSAGQGTLTYSVPNADPGSGVTYTHAVTLESPDGSAKPYYYSLFFSVTGGMPGRTTFTAHDSELAREDAVYHSQGVDTVGNRLETAYTEHLGWVMPWSVVDVPSSRAEYYTPASTWFTVFGLGDPVAGFEFGEYYAPRLAGTVKSVAWGQAPLGVGSNFAARMDDQIRFLPAMYDDSNPEVSLSDARSTAVTGSSSLIFDGEEIRLQKISPCAGSGVLPTGASGTFTFTCDTTRVNPLAKIGTASSAVWTFHSEPTPPGEIVRLPLVGVRLASPCVVNGFAPVTAIQQLTLDVTRADEVATVGTTKLTFEVSYDDGKTWKSVPVKRNGDHATASLKHPKGAKFVSTRITAVDGDGNSVTQKTIRAYGLR